MFNTVVITYQPIFISTTAFKANEFVRLRRVEFARTGVVDDDPVLYVHFK